MKVELSMLKAVLTADNDSQGERKLTLTTRAGVVLDDVEIWDPYGFTARSLVGAELVLLRIGNDPSHPLVVLGTDRRYRPTDHEPGEVTIYTDEGDKLEFLRGNLVTLTCATKFTVNCPDVEINASTRTTVNTGDAAINATGDVDVNAGGNASIQIDGSLDIDSGGTASLDAPTVNVTTDNATIDASTKVTIDAPMVELPQAHLKVGAIYMETHRHLNQGLGPPIN